MARLKESALTGSSEQNANGVTASGATVEKKLCQVGGVNQNFSSAGGTLYHIQIEDRGPVLDRLSEQEVRRINVVVYANYGEPNARIIHSRDHDFPDIRTQENNRFIVERIQDLAGEARLIIAEKEQRQVMRIKCLIREYYHTKSDAIKKEFEEANELYPFLFSRAWMELKSERARADNEVAPPPPDLGPDNDIEAPPIEVLYPLDAELRSLVIEIERIIIELAHDIRLLKARGTADDIILQTCRKLTTRAKESLSGKEPSEFTVRRLEMTRNSLMTTWKQVKSRLTRVVKPTPSSGPG